MSFVKCYFHKIFGFFKEKTQHLVVRVESEEWSVECEVSCEWSGVWSYVYVFVRKTTPK